MQQELQKYLDFVEKLRKQVQKINPHTESYNDIVASMVQDQNTLTPRKNNGFNSPEKDSSEYKGVVFQFENKLNKCIA